MKIKTIFVFNTGSSSVKISLFATTPHADAASTMASVKADTKKPIRILTAHAERIGSPLSSINISISSKSIQCIHDQILNRQDSLEHTSRMATQKITEHDNNDDDDNDDDDDDDDDKNDYSKNKEKSKKPAAAAKNDQREVVNIQITNKPNMTHEDAIRTIMEEIKNFDDCILSTVCAVGHRVVHGGSLSDAVIVDDDIMKSIREASHLAPLHNPNNLLGIEIGKEIFKCFNGDGDVKPIPQIAVFDTAFHTTIPEYAWTYPIPKEYREMKIRKYGFHGTSVKYVTKIAIEKIKQLRRLQCGSSSSGSRGTMNNINEEEESSRLIIAHLGNGASVTAVVDGKSVDTTMEFTPLSGLMMGTRSGSVDPTVVTFASLQLGKSHDEVINDLNKRSGLMSISNGDSDMRSIERRASAGDKDATLALDMFVYILAKHIASMIIACGGKVDALVFTAGIGENSAFVRKKTMERLQNVFSNAKNSTILDNTLNEQNGQHSNGVISQINVNGEEQDLVVLIIHTDEECGICEECVRLTSSPNNY